MICHIVQQNHTPHNLPFQIYICLLPSPQKGSAVAISVKKLNNEFSSQYLIMEYSGLTDEYLVLFRKLLFIAQEKKKQERYRDQIVF